MGQMMRAANWVTGLGWWALWGAAFDGNNLRLFLLGCAIRVAFLAYRGWLYGKWTV